MESIGYTLSFYCYALATISTILFGLVYATRKQIMPYHLKALETTWDNIDEKHQFLFKMLLNGGGFFGLSSGLFMLILLWIPFKAGQLWAGYTIGAVGLVGALPLLFIVYQVKTKTNGNPPLGIMIIVNLLLIVGLVSCYLTR